MFIKFKSFQNVQKIIAVIFLHTKSKLAERFNSTLSEADKSLYSYNKSQQDALFHNFILVKNSTSLADSQHN
jgi:hypothetical protein